MTMDSDKLTLSLRWGSHTETVLQSLESSFGDKDFVDVTLACDGQSVQAHKVVLSACSSYLKQLLKDNPCTHPIVILKDVGMEELRRLLEFMYCGRVTVEQHQLDSLLDAAKVLGIHGLTADETIDRSEDIIKEGYQPEDNQENARKLGQRHRRERSESPKLNKKQRPVPPLQSILAQTLLTPSPAPRTSGPVPSPGSNSDSQSQPQPTSSPCTLARLLSQSPIVMHSTSPQEEKSEVKSEDVRSSSEVEIALNVKEEALDMELEYQNPTEALELEYHTPESEDPYDADIYQQHQSSMSNEPSINESIGKATAFMLSLAKRANQLGNTFPSPSTERKLSFHEPRPCPVCRKMYRDSSTLRTHMTMMHPTSRPVVTPPLPPNGDGGSDNRLAFYEARPCSICGKMYRDAASLRTHTSIMHTMWREGFECSCKQIFQTKHEMYQHRRSHGKTRDLP